MSAPRVPAGWTQEAARLVRADWETAKEGGIPTIEGGAEDEFYVAAFKRDREVIPGLEIVDAPCDDGTPRCYARWTSPEARLRAWAAVGAPVLAPAEDGRPSLAEWVAACEGSALGQPAWSVLDSRFTDQPLQATWPQVWLRIDVEDEPTVWAGPPVQRFFTTPAELRALLDALARPA